MNLPREQYPKTGELCKIVQGPNESTTSHLARFTAVLEQIPNLIDPEITLCFQNGLQFRGLKTLIMEGPTTRAEMLMCAQRYCAAEPANTDNNGKGKEKFGNNSKTLCIMRGEWLSRQELVPGH